jgi:hypothetical protein
MCLFDHFKQVLNRNKIVERDYFYLECMEGILAPVLQITSELCGKSSRVLTLEPGSLRL